MGQTVLVLGTGGTIAGVGDGPDALRYAAAQLSVEQLVAAVPALSDFILDVQQVAQVDSKDMDWAVWQVLARALREGLARDDVAGVVITHGTDTLEETAYLLHRLVDVAKPVVLTAAMRPATSAQADGPRNLLDAVRLVNEAARTGVHGVCAVMAGRVWSARAVRKAHSWHIDDAFDGGGQDPLALMGHDGLLGSLPAWPQACGAGWSVLLDHAQPRVDIVVSHAGADGRLLDAALRSPDTMPEGVVVACTGHGTVHHQLEQVLFHAERLGVQVWRSTRVARGGVQRRDGDIWPAAGEVTVAQARVALMLELLGVPAED